MGASRPRHVPLRRPRKAIDASTANAANPCESMNLWIRLLALILRSIGKRPLPLLGVSRTRLMAWPNDLDFNRHVNNGRYLTLADLGRLEWFLRTGCLAYARRRGAWPMIGDVLAKFRREVRLFQRCTVETRLLGWNDKWAFLEHRFERRGRVIGVVAIRMLFRGPGGPLAPGVFLRDLGAPDASPRLPDWVANWSLACENMSRLLRAEEAGTAGIPASLEI